MERRKQAASFYVNGDASRLRKLVTDTAPATFFAPGGEILRGAELIQARYRRDAEDFVEGTTDIEVLDMNASGNLAYWVGIQNAAAKLRGRDHVVELELRVSEIFLRENNGWKLVHRHVSAVRGNSG